MKDRITNQQRKAFHLWLAQLAHEANNQGLTLQDMVKVIGKLEIQPNVNNLKETFVKPYILSAFGLTSTNQMNSEVINQTYDAMNKLFSYYWHIHIPFPNDEDLQNEKNKELLSALKLKETIDYPESEGEVKF